MESLNASTLSVILKIREGTGFGFLTSPFIIVCSLNGNGLTSDPLPFSANPAFESNFVWEADKKVLRSMRSHNYSIRVECFSDAKCRRSDKIGYILLNMKHQAQIISPTLGTNVTFHWHRLLGVRNDAKSFKPEIYLSLFIAEADSDLQNISPKSPPPVLPSAGAVQETSDVKEVPKKESAAQLMDNSVSKNPVQIGSPRDTDVHFKLSVKIASVHNLKSVVGDNETNTDLSLEFALFGDCFKTSDLSSREGQLEECIALPIKSQIHSLVAYFTEFPTLHFLLQSSGQTLTKVPFDMKSFLSKEKCDNLVSGKVSSLQQEKKLVLDCSIPDTECYFSAVISLEVDKNKVKNPIKPFTVSSNKRVDKTDDKSGGNKIRGVSCKTKTNTTATPREEIIVPQIDKEIPKLPNSPQGDSNNLIANGMKVCDFSDDCQNNIKNTPNNWPNQQPLPPNFNPNPQCLPQYVYPYFQPNFNFPLDGRGDSYEMLGQQMAPNLTEKVKEKITEELSKKTYEELEEWKEKQKDSYKAELKKKLDKEIKRLTNEWLSRQNELEKEATTNIEESVSLSQQLHRTSAELKVRLEAVTKQQIELEKEREELEKKYSEKHLELREASKKHQANLQQQISSLKSETEELKAKTCSLLKENEMLRSVSRLGGGGELPAVSASQLSKSTHLTEQQMASLLVDMKSLEEKLSAALESKEFFRKEWSRALREIHRMKTEQEEQVRLQLQTQRQELDNLRLVGLITADEKASKDDMASLKDLRDQIVRLNTPKTS